MTYKEKVKEYYKEMAYYYPRTLTSWRLDIIKNIPKEVKVLDLGCGTGNYLPHIRGKIYGVDLTPENIKIAKVRWPRAILKEGDITILPWGNDFFDVAYSFSTLYYIKETDKAISEITRVLKKDGIATLEFGNKWSIESIWNKITFNCPQFFFSKKYIINQFKKNNMEIINIQYRQVIPNFKNRFDNNFVKNKFLQPICFRLIFTVKKR